VAKLSLRHRDLHEVRTEDHPAAEARLPGAVTVRDFLTREGARLGQEVNPAVEVTPRGSALYLAVAGAGVAMLPRPVAQLGRSHGVEIASLRPRQTRQVYLLRRTAPLSPAARAIRALLEPAHPAPQAGPSRANSA
jgi:DNA-binding transcriptional LysR family regulator